MNDRNVKLFLLFAGFYFVSKDVSAAIVLYNRKKHDSDSQAAKKKT